MILAPRLAWGGPSDIAVRINCPVLSDVSAAEFEARAKVDLSARAARDGELEVLCDNLAARIRWRQRGGAWFARAMAPTQTPTVLVDAMLVVSKELVEEASRFEQAGSGDRATDPTDPKVMPDLTAPSAADLADPAESQRSPDPAREPSRTARGADGRAASPEAAAPPGDRSGADSRAPEKWAWGVSVGASAALFSTRGSGVAGPSVGTFVQLPAGFVASLEGEYGFGIGAGDLVSVRVASAAAVIAAQFGPMRSFEVGVGGLAGSVFGSSEPPYQPSSLSQGFWGAIVRGRYALRTDAWRFAVGPDVRFHGLRPDVAVDRTAVWGVPVVSVGIALEVSRELYGSR